MSRFKILSYCFLGLVLTLNNSCSYEEQENNPNSAIKTQLQNELKLDQFTNKNISENTAVNWNNINVFKKDSLEVYEIELVEKNDIKIKSKHFQADLKYELIAVKQNNVIHSYLIEAFSSAKNKLFSGTIQDLNSYSGTLNIYDLSGKQINQLLVKNGNASNTSNDMSLEPLKNVINMFYKPSKKNLTNRLPDCTMEFSVPIHHDIYKEEYKIVMYETGQIIDIFYLGTKLIDSYNTYTYMSVEYPCDSSADEVHIPYTTIVRNTETVSNITDPCNTGILISSLSQSTQYLSAKSKIVGASSNGHEFSITLGKDANNNITQAPMVEGGLANVPPNTTWLGAFAAIHNHPNTTPLSAGDIYASVKLNVTKSSFTTSFVVLPDGSVYAAVVTNLAAAKAFVATYPADQIANYPPEFPDKIFNEMLDLVNIMGSSIEGRTRAMAFVLDKYNSGITLLKQDSSGQFNPIKTQETIQNGIKTYTNKPCN
ncbi:hypothetical protein D3C85_504870 [compost metagenome]